MKIIPGPSSTELGRKIAEILGVETVSVAHKKFPDSESYIRLEGEVKGEEIVIVQSTGPPQDTNLIQLFILADAAKDLGAKRVIAIVPYLAYARQDKRFLPGEAISIQTIGKLLKTSGIDELITVNVHEREVLEKFEIPAKSISAIELLADYFKSKGLERAFALAPDEGAAEFAIEASKVLGGDYGWLHKERDRYTGEVRTEEKNLDVSGKDAIIFDDIISTGGTTANAVKILRKQGARRVFAACVHPLMIGNAKERILQAGAEEIVGTDSVPSNVTVVSLAPLLAKALTEKIKG
ncbi:MAG TPA: ribose-phosphate diphosphokinase [Candidatus Bathyarchaeota archaeon]|nr:ribose-phosphate diphosphokinase [Candidatus Bathyarchaeota archaeon]